MARDEEEWLLDFRVTEGFAKDNLLVNAKAWTLTDHIMVNWNSAWVFGAQKGFVESCYDLRDCFKTFHPLVMVISNGVNVCH